MKILILLIISSLCFDTSIKAKTPKDSVSNSHKVEVDLQKKVLSNGLTVILIKNSKLPLFSFYAFVKVGARHETPGMTGASHFLEHLMFKGSKRYPKGEYDTIVAGNGGTNNAYTSQDLTVYYENLPVAALDKILDLESDRLFNLTIDKADFEKERYVILEERKYRYENSPRGQLLLGALTKAYKGTPYEDSVIGSIKDLKSVTHTQIKDYFQTFYDPSNIVITIAGDLDYGSTFEKIEKLFSKIPSTKKFEKIKKEKDSLDLYKLKPDWGKTYNFKGQSPQPMFSIIFPGDRIGTKKSFVLDILSSVLGGGDSSYLNQQYVYSKKPNLSYIYAYNYGLEKAGLFMIGGELLKGKSLKYFKKNFHENLKRVCKNAINEREIQKVKNQYLVDYFKSFETNADLAQLIGLREIYYSDPHYYSKEIQEYMSITMKDVLDACNEMISGQKPIFVTVWDKN